MSASHDHSHSHAVTVRSADRRRLAAALAVTATVLIAELVGALISGSLALLADAAHMFTDLAALLLAFAAATLAEQKSTSRYTFGLYRTEILAAFINAEILLVAAGYIFYQGYQRLTETRPVEAGIMLGVAVLGLIANLAALLLLRGGNHDSLNLRAAYLEVLSDALGSAAVIVAAIVILPTGWYWLDPVVSIGIALAILPRTITILRQSGHVLLEGSPHHTDVAELSQELAAIPGVAEVHDFHFWTLTSGVDSVSVHVRIDSTTERFSVRRQVESLLRDRMQVDHITVQVEEASEANCAAEGAHP